MHKRQKLCHYTHVFNSLLVFVIPNRLLFCLKEQRTAYAVTLLLGGQQKIILFYYSLPDICLLHFTISVSEITEHG
jgi:hypothetical protein